MTHRRDLYQVIDALPEADLDDALALLTALRARDAHLAELTAQRDQDTEARYQAAIAEGVRYADAPGSLWASQEDMEAWLLSWGTDHELPPPAVHPRG